MHLTAKQTKALILLQDKTTNDLIFGGGAGGGKSALGVYWLMKSCLKYPGTRWLMGRASLKTLKETTLNSFYDVAATQGLKAGVHYVYNGQTNTIKFANGSEILCKDLFLYPSDPNFDELGSLEITGAFIDEVNQIVEKAWNVVKSRIRYKLDEYNLIPKMMGSCNPAKNWVYLKFYKPSIDNTLPEGKAFIQSLLTDNPHISKHYRENLLQLDIASKERLLYGNWQYSDDPSELMPFNKITDLFSNSFVEGGEKFITADIARFGSDKTIIGVWDGLRLFKIVTIDKNKVTEAAEQIRQLSSEYKVPNSNIIVDDDGVGGGVTDILGCIGFVNNSSPLENPETFEKENYNNLKSQCYFNLAKLVNSNAIYLESSIHNDTITQELEQVKQYKMDQDGKKQIVPKEKVKELLGRSPDFSDMIMMRVYFVIAPKRNIFFF
jgi:hypothetical protein